jgi:hypothetical protein
MLGGSVSLLELFSATRRKFGEVLLRVDLAVPKPMDFSLLLGASLAGAISAHRRSNASTHRYRDFRACGAFPVFDGLWSVS